jgi:hypothetical protein
MYHFCTIASGNFLPFVHTLFASLQKQEANTTLHVLVTDDDYQKPTADRLHFYSLKQLAQSTVIERILHQYANNNNHLRWALKPAFLHFLLQENEAVIYVDNDIAFFSSYQFLFKMLERNSVVLTPHWFCKHPYPQPENFTTNFQIGLFNAGFVGASKKGIDFLAWWAEACLYRMQRAEDEGYYDDQRYLDMALLVDENVGIVRHLGCNIGSWNMHQNQRTEINGQVLINGTFPIVFIHFNHETVKHILNGNDHLLRPYYKEYEAMFARTGHTLSQYIPLVPEWKQQTLRQALLRKTKIRTRIKGWLFRLSQKL